MKNLLDFEKPIFEIQTKLEELRKQSESLGVSAEEEIKKLERNLAETKKTDFENLTAWQRVQMARHPSGRSRWIIFSPPSTISMNCTETGFTRKTGRCWAVSRGWGAPGDGHRHAKRARHEGEHSAQFRFGAPEGYRKALRLMKMADKFGLPVITLIDTAGAYPGIGAEERHIAEPSR